MKLRGRPGNEIMHVNYHLWHLMLTNKIPVTPSSSEIRDENSVAKATCITC